MKTTDRKHAEGGSDILSRIIRRMMDPTWFMEQRRGFDRIRFDARMSAALRDGDETDLFTRYLVARALDPTLTDQDMIDLLVGADDDSDSGDDGGPVGEFTLSVNRLLTAVGSRLRAGAAAPAPSTPAAVDGVMDAHGRLLAHLAKRFEPARPEQAEPRYVQGDLERRMDDLEGIIRDARELRRHARDAASRDDSAHMAEDVFYQMICAMSGVYRYSGRRTVVPHRTDPTDLLHAWYRPGYPLCEHRPKQDPDRWMMVDDALSRFCPFNDKKLERIGTELERMRDMDRRSRVAVTGIENPSRTVEDGPSLG